jgi:hypothetical protein
VDLFHEGPVGGALARKGCPYRGFVVGVVLSDLSQRLTRGARFLALQTRGAHGGADFSTNGRAAFCWQGCEERAG